ncbi:molybdenum cofactor guanylyltransferase [Marinagarivorans algicola]|uniref:molybdenum cofactor guanylyltransferase n=1 Tax=Marinagarivorans algicola TaxID=1513270 RepID=UPI0006B58C1D|nr:molybdenum cofactor guanylyltransferase [Marinagarivorans algicola]
MSRNTPHTESHTTTQQASINRQQPAAVPFAGLVLAGGQSTRMGLQNKALVEYDGQPLLQYSLQKGLACASTTLISTGPHIYKHPFLASYVHLPDNGTQGPLAGIHQGLLWLAEQLHLEWLAVIPCDTPWVPSDWAGQLLNAGRISVNPDRPNASSYATQALYVVHHNRHHYAHSLWHKNSLHTVQQALQSRQRALKQVLQKLNTQAIDLTDHYPKDSFTNINTLDTLKACYKNKV